MLMLPLRSGGNIPIIQTSKMCGGGGGVFLMMGGWVVCDFSAASGRGGSTLFFDVSLKYTPNLHDTRLR